MLQVRQPPANLLLLQEVGKVHQGHHSSTTAAAGSPLLAPQAPRVFAFSPG